MFSETISLSIYGSTVNFHKINQDKYSSEYMYKDANGEIRLNIRNTSYVDKKVPGLRIDRHNYEVIGVTWATGGATHDTVLKAYGVFEVPSNATQLQVTDFVPGVFAFLTSANVVKMFNFES